MQRQSKASLHGTFPWPSTSLMSIWLCKDSIRPSATWNYTEVNCEERQALVPPCNVTRQRLNDETSVNILGSPVNMPRPKVPPDQRQRASEACKLCQEVKKRCSGVAPCSHCLRRGLGSSCVILNRPRRQRKSMAQNAARSADPSPELSSAAAHLAASSPSQSRPAPAATQAPASRAHDFGPISPSDSRMTDIECREDETLHVRRQEKQSLDDLDVSLRVPPTSPRMLRNARGERGTAQ